jgi:sentrin-specific protease 1
MTNGARSKKNTILNVHYFNSFFFEKLSQEGYEKARLAKWTKKVRCLLSPERSYQPFCR